MWKKAEPDRSERRVPATPARAPEGQASTGSGAAPSRSEGVQMAVEHPSDRAIIGPSITIKGDVTGEEDLLIQGRVEGKVDLAQHHVTVGANGRIKANVLGRSVTVEGEVEGDLHAEEQIAIRKSGKVHGNLVAPRVTIEDGATFQGSIDMDRKVAPAQRPATPPALVGHTSASPAAGSGTPSPSGPSAGSGAARPGEPKRPDRSG